jgi:hypothetical protein
VGIVSRHKKVENCKPSEVAHDKLALQVREQAALVKVWVGREIRNKVGQVCTYMHRIRPYVWKFTAAKNTAHTPYTHIR